MGPGYRRVNLSGKGIDSGGEFESEYGNFVGRIPKNDLMLITISHSLTASQKAQLLFQRLMALSRADELSYASSFIIAKY